MPGSCTTIDLGAFDDTREAVRRDPEAGKGAFVAVTNGAAIRSQVALA